MKKKIFALAALFAACGVAAAIARDKETTVDIDAQSFVPLATRIDGESVNLLLSDSPEYVGPEGGVLAAGIVTGPSRVYYYHVNEMKKTQKIAIVAKNEGNDDTFITVSRRIMAQPDEDYFAVGRELSHKELETNTMVPQTIVVRGKGRTLLYPDLENVPVKEDQLFSGIVDFTTTGPVLVKVIMLPFQDKSIGASYTAKPLPMDHVRLRGTYKGAKRLMTILPPYDAEVGAAYIELANGREDSYLKGEDELTDNERVEDTGNYGVSYTISLATMGKGQYDMFFNPQGGAYAGSVRITSAGASRIIDVPGKGRPYVGEGTTRDTFHLGTYAAGKSVQLNFMPAGASNLPVRILLVPHAEVATESRLSAGAQAIRNKLLPNG